MDKIVENLRLLHETPYVPLYMLQSKDGKVFDVDKGSPFLPKHDILSLSHKPLENRVEYKIKLKTCDFPNIEFANSKIPRDGDFYTFLSEHQHIAGKLTDIFYKTSFDNLLSVVAYVRERVHPHLFFYALNAAFLHRNDTKGIKSNVIKAFPTKFIHSHIIKEQHNDEALDHIKEEYDLSTVPKPSSALFIEQSVAYFREDIALNSHHWHWHGIYPFSGDKNIMNKDRRGELFYYMHQQMVARYNSERLCNSLNRVKPFDYFNDNIEEGYYSKLYIDQRNTEFSGRPTNMKWTDVNRPDMVTNIQDMITWKKKIEQAIDDGFYLKKTDSNEVSVPNSFRQRLDINTLGNILEATSLSPNKDLYGNLHNSGHIITAFIHDPDNRHLQPMNVMADAATTMRDPFFYRWHSMIDDIFQRFKTSHSCPAYKNDELAFPGIKIKAIEIAVESKTFPESINHLHTFMRKQKIYLAGLTVHSTEPVCVKFEHLDHEPFEYNFVVENEKEPCRGTVRIFMAPKFNENGDRLNLDEQRRLFIEMDRFVCDLNHGDNLIRRQSIDSSLTIPFNQSFSGVLSKTQNENAPIPSDTYCNCGWPQHLLVPKGTPNGITYELFVMISDYNLDKVKGSCPSRNYKEALSFCGLKDKKYPDKRDMGYPFDRQIDAKQIDTFVEHMDNMILQEIKICFSAKTVE